MSQNGEKMPLGTGLKQAYVNITLDEDLQSWGCQQAVELIAE